jgi:signal peptidase II
MKTKLKILAAIFPGVFLLDQASKALVEAMLPIGIRIPVIPGLFDIVHFRNTGAAFGLFSGLPDDVRVPFFYAVAAVAVVLLALLFRAIGGRERMMACALSLVFGGIAGNILDRIRLGAVIDFLSLHLGNAALEGSALGNG